MITRGCTNVRVVASDTACKSLPYVISNSNFHPGQRTDTQQHSFRFRIKYFQVILLDMFLHGVACYRSFFL